MHLTLHIWRQRGSGLPGGFVRYAMTDVSPDMSFLEMLDVLNQQLLARKDEPIAFDHDCREGICGMCGMVINGRDRKSTRLNSSHTVISYAVFCLKKKKNNYTWDKAI